MPGGMWDANTIEIAAWLKRDGAPAGTVPLTYAGAPSQFTATLSLEEPGTYEATVYAYDATNGNTGLDRVTFIVTR